MKLSNKSALFAAAAVLTALTPVGAVQAQGQMQHGKMQPRHMQAGKMQNMQHGKMQPGHMKMGMASMGSLAKLKGKQFDVAFLSQMIAHHQAALTMSRDARPSLKDTHVREHAQEIIASQTKEIREMGALLQTDYKTKPSMAQMNTMKADMKGMMAMKPTSDHMFLEMMIPHHQGAVEMSQLALKNSSSPKVKALASRIIKDQNAEIADFKKMLAKGVGVGAAHSH